MGPPAETLAEIAAFLERYPPFSALREDALADLASATEIEYFARGTEILAQEGHPSEHLYVVRRGSVELLDEGDVVDVLEEGEAFGHPSVLSGLPPVLTARAREDSLCYLFPAESTVAALSDPAGLRFVAASLESRLQRVAARAHRATTWGTGRVGTYARGALTCSPRTSVREAAAQMTERDDNAVVVLGSDEYGLVTDGDLRAKVIAEGLDADVPLSEVMRRAPTALATTFSVDALVDMLRAGVEHLVVVDDGGNFVGLVDQTALLDLDAASPLKIRRAIEQASDLDELRQAVQDVPSVVVRLLDAGIETLDVLVLVATMTDALTRRLGELAIAELGEPPVPWAWLALGSEARREQTPATDQDNALAYDGDAPELDGYFVALAERMNRWLAYCGHPECRAGVMARNRGWRLPRSAWIELFESWLRDPTRHAVEIAMIASDFRTVTGPLSIGRNLDPILEEAVHHPLFLERLASAAVELRPPTGFLREFVVERSGEHAGTLDIKDGGVLPIVNLARFHALSAGSSAKPTLDRLHAAAAAGSITTESAAQLEEAFVTVGRVRIEHQAAQLERGVQADNHIAPRDLPPSTRSELKRAFRAIARAQRRVETHVATRIP